MVKSKKIMKKSMVTHFNRMQQLDQYPTLQRNSPFITNFLAGKHTKEYRHVERKYAAMYRILIHNII